MNYKLIPIISILVISFSCQKETPPNEIEFEYIKNEIILSVTINKGGPFKMLLDTGFDPSVIDLETAKSLNLQLRYCSIWICRRKR